MSTHPYLSNGFVAMAHRGGSLLPDNVGKENTLTAFEHAVGLGYRYLETDVHLTADGELVAFHDDRLDRVSDAHGLIAELTWAQVQRVRVNGEPIPLFREVLDTFPGANLNVDLKAPGAGAPLAALLADRDAFDRVCVGSFSSARLAEYRRLAGPRALTSSSRVEVVAQMAAGLVSLPAPGAAGAHQVPVRRAVAGRQVPVVTRGFVRGAHRAGRQVHVWTIDDPDQMHHLIDLGVDGIVSDAIDVLKTVLISRGLWTGR
ncbi:glycerophosphodiester phosphodiesterase [Aestuariimicrobium sp. T2.26MG-19.2B]|uniref:glycerophosphodiester phosphodiesterase n=1 Tax=Aestuariimicrobium sp. T2.26MG-19.2B TaxID=3040679 RepID=UPI0025423C8C|nr:glycerophosphodiester phosphodiesterase [Aestuariimicrobium sp. T2.26MG-19.2B]